MSLETPPTRDQLAAITRGDERALRAFEDLFTAGALVSQNAAGIVTITQELDAQAGLITSVQGDVSDLGVDVVRIDGVVTELAGGTTGQVLAKASDTSHDFVWVAPASSGGAVWGAIAGTLSSQTDLQTALDLKSNTTDYSLFKTKGNTSAADIANTEAAIVWGTATISSADVSVAGAVLTINTSGIYRFSVSMRVDANNHAEAFIRTYIDTGGGLAQDTDEVASGIAAIDAGQNTGTVSLSTALALDSGDELEFRGFAAADGTCVMVDAGTRLIVELVG